MKNKVTKYDFSNHLFWDIDFSELDLDKHKEFMIARVLEYGLINDWTLLKSFYGMDVIKEISLNIKSLDIVSLSFISTVLKIKKEEFRCYKHSQSVKNYWNS